MSKMTQKKVAHAVGQLRKAHERASEFADENADIIGPWRTLLRRQKEALDTVKSAVREAQGRGELPSKLVIDERLGLTASIPHPKAVDPRVVLMLPKEMLTDGETVVPNAGKILQHVEMGKLPPEFEKFVREGEDTVRVNFAKQLK